MTSVGQVHTGLDRVLDNPSLLGSEPITLCANYTAVTADLGRGVDALIRADVPVTSLLTPEHGYWGAAQAGYSDGDGVDARTGLPVLDTYQIEGSGLDEVLERSGSDHIVLDLQDIGTRFYTYMWTMFDLLCSAARTRRRVTILDRPNPLGRREVGPGLESSCASFIGRVSIPLQHGLTLGELARWFNASHIPAIAGRSADLEIIELSGSDGSMPPDSPWVLPSPNMPTMASTQLYPAIGLIEGTTLSEGRGTTKPFELFGAAWTDGRLADALRDQETPGVLIREAVFRPTFSKWANETVHGAQIHLDNPTDFEPITLGYAILRTVADLYPEHQLWREPHEGRPPFLDLLWGSASLREGIDQGTELPCILRNAPPAPQVPTEAILYPNYELR